VRPAGNGLYEVVDGFHRYNCCKELRMASIPCLVRDLTDSEVLVVQVQTTAVRLEAEPVEYGRQLWRIINEDRTMTVAELARAVKKSPVWVNKMLRLRKLCPQAKAAVERGQVAVTVAHELAKLPDKMQRKLLPQAIVLPVTDFLPVVVGIIRKFKHALKTGSMKDYYRSLIEPVPHLRKMTELRAELKLPTAGSSLITRLKMKTPLEGWRACLDWVLHLDPDAVKAHEDKNLKCQAEVERNAELRMQDRKNRRGKIL